MDERAYKVLTKIHALLKGKTQAELTGIEIAYITGLLESMLDLCSGEETTVPDEAKLEPFYKRFGL